MPHGRRLEQERQRRPHEAPGSQQARTRRRVATTCMTRSCSRLSASSCTMRASMSALPCSLCSPNSKQSQARTHSHPPCAAFKVGAAKKYEKTIRRQMQQRCESGGRIGVSPRRA